MDDFTKIMLDNANESLEPLPAMEAKPKKQRKNGDIGKQKPQFLHVLNEKNGKTNEESERDSQKAADNSCTFLFSEEKFQNDLPNVPNVPTPEINFDDAVNAQDETLLKHRQTLDSVIANSHDDPGKLISPEFQEALNFVKKHHPELALTYRVQIKRTKPSGVLLSEVFDDCGLEEGEQTNNDGIASDLIELALESGELFYDEKADKSFISLDIGGIEHTFSIGGGAFVEWLSFAYYQSTANPDKGIRGKSASEACIKQARFALSGIAKHDGERQRVYLRVADKNDGHYLFMANDKLQTIEVLPIGWRVIDKAPVKFWKSPAMQALPTPVNNGNLEALWEFVNIQPADRPLLLAWILECYRSETPKPVLALSGTQGSAKSSTQNKIRLLVDNSAVNLRAAPKAVQDVFVNARSNWLVSYENLSHLNAAMQDAFCTLATGGGFSARSLYTDDEETIIEAKRPIILNSIPIVITAQDLTDRAINLELPRIDYREELELETAWQAVLPAIFGGILDLLVKTLQRLPKVKLYKPPRMADFARLGEAMCQAMGKPEGAFIKLYRVNLHDGVTRALESSPAAVAIREMSEQCDRLDQIVFYGTVKKLLNDLTPFKHDSHNWPASPKGLADIIRRQLPAFHAIGIDITVGDRHLRVNGEQGIPVTIKKFASGNIGNIGKVDLKLFSENKKSTEKLSGFSDKVEV